MGQRLTIQIFKNKEQEQSLATLYYHWSAYTESALEELKSFYSKYLRYLDTQKRYQKAAQDHPLPGDVVLPTSDLDATVVAIYQAIIEDGGGFAFKEHEKATQLHPILDSYADPNRLAHRSCGILAFSEEVQEVLYSWSEGNINLYLDEEDFEFDVYCSYDVSEDQELFESLITEWFNEENIDKVTDEQIIDYCVKNLPKFDNAQYHKIDDIDAMIELFEEHDVFYDADEELIIQKIY